MTAKYASLVPANLSSNNGSLGAAVALAQERLFTLFKEVPFKMKTVKYSPFDKLRQLAVSILAGCHSNRQMNSRLRGDRLSAEMAGMQEFADQSQINLLLRRADEATLTSLHRVLSVFVKRIMPKELKVASHPTIVDVDVKGLAAQGRTFEEAKKGYFNNPRHRKGYHLAVAYLGSPLRLLLGFDLKPGNAHCLSSMDALLEIITQTLGKPRTHSIVIRGDGNYGSRANINSLLKQGFHVLIKGYVPKEAFRLSKDLEESAWIPWEDKRFLARSSSTNLSGIDFPVRILLLRELVGDRYVYSHLITDLNEELFGDLEIIELYYKRQTIEALFKAADSGFGLNCLRSRKLNAIKCFLYVFFACFNLLAWALRTLSSKANRKGIGVVDFARKLTSSCAAAVYQKGRLCIYRLAWDPVLHEFLSNLHQKRFLLYKT